MWRVLCPCADLPHPGPDLPSPSSLLDPSPFFPPVTAGTGSVCQDCKREQKDTGPVPQKDKRCSGDARRAPERICSRSVQETPSKACSYAKQQKNSAGRSKPHDILRMYLEKRGPLRSGRRLLLSRRGAHTFKDLHRQSLSLSFRRGLSPCRSPCPRQYCGRRDASLCPA